MDTAIELLEQAVELRRAAGDPRSRAVALVAAVPPAVVRGAAPSRRQRPTRRRSGCSRTLPPGPELALAYSNISSVALNDERHDETVDWGKRALDLAEQLDDTAVVVHSLNNLGTIELLGGRPEGREALERSLRAGRGSRAGGAHRPGVHPSRLGGQPDPRVRAAAAAGARHRAVRGARPGQLAALPARLPGPRRPRPRPVGRGGRARRARAAVGPVGAAAEHPHAQRARAGPCPPR